MTLVGGLVLLATAGAAAAGPSVRVPGEPGRHKSAAEVRAERRAFDGAPPVIPHQPFGADCAVCHTKGGIEVQNVGFAPPSPHDLSGGGGAMARCRQCHVFRQTDALWVPTAFEGLRQDLRRGARENDFAPPTIPHLLQMRENCLACHSGPAAREEIRTTHPEQVRCLQCHVPVRTTETFDRTNVPADPPQHP